MQWVLSRPLYRFSRFDLKHVAMAQRMQALRLQIRQWSPYTNPGCYVVWRQEDALVWAWDANRLDTDLSKQNLKLRATRVIPESLLHPTLKSGARLVTTMDGVEGQIWKADNLAHSRWWSAVPNAAEWLNFHRDAGIRADEPLTIPAAQAVTLSPKPWAQSSAVDRQDGLSLPHETRLVRGAALVLVICSVWFGVEFIKAKQAIGHLKTQLAENQQKALPVDLARRKAFAAITRIETLQANNLYPPQLALMAEVSNALPKEGVTLSEWNYQDGKLRITIASTSKLANSFLVKRIQDTGWFKNVQAIASDSSSVTLAMEAQPQNAILPQQKTTVELNSADKPENAMEALKSSPKNSP